MVVLYIFLIIFAIATIVASVYARKKIAECKIDDERKLVKARWQLICGLLGVACIIFAAVIIFTMF